jgi:hypothetical protein
MMCSGMGWICILKDLVLNRRDYFIIFFHVWLVMNKIKEKLAWRRQQRQMYISQSPGLITLTKTLKLPHTSIVTQVE